jgi:hypothetical protein
MLWFTLLVPILARGSSVQGVGDTIAGKRTRDTAFSTDDPSRPNLMVRVVEALVADPFVQATEIQSEDFGEVEDLILRYRPYVVISKWFFDHFHIAGGILPHHADIYAAFERAQKATFHPETASNIAQSWVTRCVVPLIHGEQKLLWFSLGIFF